MVSYARRWKGHSLPGITLYRTPLPSVFNNVNYVTVLLFSATNNQQHVVFNKGPALENNARQGLSSVAASLEPTWHALGA
jgi:hypothetical protein